ncbi:unnamed protein product, partial [marine sediment metagenome]
MMQSPETESFRTPSFAYAVVGKRQVKSAAAPCGGFLTLGNEQLYNRSAS